MFNRSSFDRTMYNRSSNFDTVEAALRGTSSLKTGLVVQLYLEIPTFSGSGGIQSTPKLVQFMQGALTGNGGFDLNDFRLQLGLSTTMTGSGAMEPGIAMQTPLGDIVIGGSSKMTDSKTYLLQTMSGHFRGSGRMTMPLNLRVSLASHMQGQGGMAMNDQFRLLLPLTSKFSGKGSMELRRIGALNSDTLEFENLNLQPGQTLIIDTDELDVLIDNIPNVDSVTNDSVFFHLQPGENELTFLSEDNPDLEVVVIWQNRWL